jgi:hypothetical protein
MESVDKRVDDLLAQCVADADRAQQFVFGLGADAVRLSMAERRRLLAGEARSQAGKRADLVARHDPKFVATVIKGWMADER